MSKLIPPKRTDFGATDYAKAYDSYLGAAKEIASHYYKTQPAHATHLNQLRIQAAIAIASGDWATDEPSGPGYICKYAERLVAEMNKRGWTDA